VINFALVVTKNTILEVVDISNMENKVLSAAIRLLIGCTVCCLARSLCRCLNFVDVETWWVKKLDLAGRWLCLGILWIV